MPFIQFQLRRGLASEWTSVNPILASGEMGLETDTYKVKVGDGVLNWNDLPYGIGQADLQAVTLAGNTTNTAISITNSAVSSNSVTGALTVTGGVGIGGNLNVGNNITITGNASVNSLSANTTVATNLVLGNAAVINVGTSPTVIDSFAVSAYSTAKYIVRAINGASYHSMEAFLVNDGVNVYLTVYASLKNNNNLISLSADINGSNVELKATGASVGNSVKLFATRI